MTTTCRQEAAQHIGIIPTEFSAQTFILYERENHLRDETVYILVIK